MHVRRTLAGLLGLFIALQIGCASPGEPSINELVASAVSPADDLEIAAYYQEKAAEMRELSAMHRRLAEAYGGRWTRGRRFASHQSEHCEKLANAQEEAAVEYEQLALEHEKLAAR